MKLLYLIFFVLAFSFSAFAEPIPSPSPCSPGARCLTGTFPVTTSAMFSDAVLNISLSNLSDVPQTVNAMVYSSEALAFDDDFLPILDLKLVNVLNCGFVLVNLPGLPGAKRACQLRSRYQRIDAFGSLSIPIRLKVALLASDEQRAKSGAFYKIEVTPNNGNLNGLLLIYKNEQQNWVGLGCAVTGCGVGGATGTVSNTIIFPLNGGKPF